MELNKTLWNSLGDNECGQIDTVDEKHNRYCEPEGVCAYKIVDHPDCSGTPKKKPENKTCRIQGYKVLMPNNQKAEPAASQTVSLAGGNSVTTNPYYLEELPPGNKTVSVSVPDKYTVGYTLCTNDTGCHGDKPTPGSSVSFDCPEDGYVDLWWHYTPPRLPMCKSSSIDKQTIAPDKPVNITMTTDRDDVTHFWIAFYNKDNQYPNSQGNNPKPIRFEGDEIIHKIDYYSDTPVKSHVFTIDYNEINQPDLNFGGKYPINIQVNGYFANGEQWSNVDKNCVQSFKKQLTIHAGPSCMEIKAYKVSGDLASASSWEELSGSELANLKAGDVIYLTVSGSSSSDGNGVLDKAKLIINDEDPIEFSDLKPKAPEDPENISEFYYKYTIPENSYTFTINGQVHDTKSGWF